MASPLAVGALTSTVDEPMNLDVGGSFYTTLRSTLIRYPNSKLALMFSKDDGLPPVRDGRYFIDRDGPIFQYILNFLIDQSKLSLPDGFKQWDILMAEADFYQLAQLKTLIAEERTKREREKPIGKNYKQSVDNDGNAININGNVSGEMTFTGNSLAKQNCGD
ncbi:BTB/POZ domain-containing protein KCTD6-like [Antedon mediterranea]|uniref:BTB/POZ domain-containing protein KCTD6-like n=1 Tax=Antedon mediterranea TaxID=105859 RepID=UPI003AF65752